MVVVDADNGLAALKLEYNYLNLTGAVKDAATNTVKASYRWLADGSKTSVKNAAGTGGYEYLSSLIYTRTSASAVALESAAFSGGRINKTSGGYDINYFLTDHLGSTRVVVNGATGKAIERNDYYPFGMKQPVAVHPTTTNRFRFSGKENQTTGDLPLQDFGARLYNSRIGRWITRDQLAQKYYPYSPYNYCLNNPINAIDPNGKLVIFVNGMHLGDGGTSKYWGGMDKLAMSRLNDNKALYFDGAMGGTEGLYNSIMFAKLLGPHTPKSINADDRYNAGYEKGQMVAASILGQLTNDETIKFITHSMGAAYAKGMIQALIDNGIDPALIVFEADFAPYQPTKQSAIRGIPTFQFSHSKDWIATDERMPGAEYMDTTSDPNQRHWITDFERQILSLPAGNYKVVNGEFVSY